MGRWSRRALDFEQVLPTPADLLDGADYEAPGIPTQLPGWYAWRREHWGVKWNASAVRRTGHGRTGRVRYRSLTPYGPPAALLDRLSAAFPEVAMESTYEVELLGHGAARWRAGTRSYHLERSV